MKSLFEQNKKADIPLADRMRPRDFNEFYGQEDLTGRNKPFRKMIEADRLSSIILWGPPGTGKTTIARIIAQKTNSYFEEFSAVTSGVNDLRRVVKEAKNRRELYKLRTVLFVDEIHRFNKSQQDGFLPHIENGTLILVGATTENPGFEINSALLSRSSLFELKKLKDTDIKHIIQETLKDDERGLGRLKLTMDAKALDYLVATSDGDARRVLNALEIIGNIKVPKKQISARLLKETLNKKVFSVYKKSDEHYDLISAFIKSMRGSDPDAAVYWLARMIEGGEDPKFIARRMIIFASEDIGNAAPMALLIATACFDAINIVGLPEGRINLSQCAIYLSSAPKSNASYTAIDDAISDVRNTKTNEVPKHLKNAPTKLAKDLGYGKDYKYPHSYDKGWVEQTYLPEEIRDKKYYKPTKNGAEKEITDRLARLKHKK
jgi:putative ATPase